MANPKFTKGENELIFSRGLQYPVHRISERIQTQDRNGVGSLVVEDLGYVIKKFSLSFKDLPLADYTALDTWYNETAVGAANTFTYTDHDSVDYTVRWVSGSFDFPETFYQQYSGTIELEVEQV